MKQLPWLKLYRDIIHSDVFADPIRLQGWVWLLASVAAEATSTVIAGRTIVVAPGSLATTQAEMAAALGWTRSRVRSFVEWLVEQEMVHCTNIDAGKRAVGMIIEVQNWGRYQSVSSAAPEMQPQKKPAKRPTASSRSTKSQPQNPPEMQPQTAPLRARDSSLEEEERSLVVEERASAPIPAVVDEDIRAQACIRPTARVTDDGVVVVQFEMPPQRPTTRALLDAGFVYHVDAPPRQYRSSRPAQSWWMADLTEQRLALAQTITGGRVSMPVRVDRVEAPVEHRAPVPKPTDCGAGAKLRAALATAIGAASMQAAFGAASMSVDVARRAVLLRWPDEMSALLAQRRYGRVVQRLCGEWTAEFIGGAEEVRYERD